MEEEGRRGVGGGGGDGRKEKHGRVDWEPICNRHIVSEDSATVPHYAESCLELCKLDYLHSDY